MIHYCFVFYFMFQQEQYKQTFPAQLKKQESSKSLKKVIAALSNPKPTSSSPAHPKQTLENSNPNPFLTNALLGNHQPNGVIQSVIQEAPLALTTKTKMQSKINENIATASSTPFPSPVNLSTSGRRTPGNQTTVIPSPSPILHSQGKEKAVSNNVNTVKTQHHSHPAKSLVEQFRGTDSDILSSKDSEDSNEDEEEDDEEDEEDDEDDDSDDSQSGCFLFLSLKCFSKCYVNQNILKRFFKSRDLKLLSFTVSCSSVPFYTEW